MMRFAKWGVDRINALQTAIAQEWRALSPTDWIVPMDGNVKFAEDAVFEAPEFEVGSVDTPSVMAALGDLGLASDGIGEVVALVTHVAARTGALALDATRAAVQAGENGRDLAAVSVDVEALRVEAERAHGEIAELVVAVQGLARGTMSAISAVEASLVEIDRISTGVRAGVVSDEPVACDVPHALDSEALDEVMDAGRKAQALRDEVSVFLRSLEAA